MKRTSSIRSTRSNGGTRRPVNSPGAQPVVQAADAGTAMTNKGSLKNLAFL